MKSQLRAEQIEIARQLLRRRNGMWMSMTPVDYLKWRMGVSTITSIDLIEAVKKQGDDGKT